MEEIDWVQYKEYNERDIEVPKALHMLERQVKFHDAQSLLDVGAHYSGHTYAKEFRKIMGDKYYDGVDMFPPDPETIGILNNYKIGNVLDVYEEYYDIITCISTIEHCGLRPATDPDYSLEQLKVFKHLVKVANKGIIITFPFGLEGVYPNEYANITPDQLARFTDAANEKFTHSAFDFFYNKFAQGKEKWYRVTPDFAMTVPLDKKLGVQCVCIAEFWKGK